MSTVWLVTAEEGSYSDAIRLVVAAASTEEAARDAAAELAAWLAEVEKKYGDDGLLDGEKYGWDGKNLPGPPGGALWDWGRFEFRRLREVEFVVSEVPVWSAE